MDKEISQIEVDGPVSMDGTAWVVTIEMTYHVTSIDSHSAILQVLSKIEEME